MWAVDKCKSFLTQCCNMLLVGLECNGVNGIMSFPNKMENADARESHKKTSTLLCSRDRSNGQKCQSF